MKKLAFCLVLFLSACVTNNDEKVISVMDYVNKPDSVLQKDIVGGNLRDLKIVSISPLIQVSSKPQKACYMFVINHMIDNKLKASKDFLATSDNLYEKASYKWSNDSTLKIRMYNTTNTNAEKYIISYQKNGNASIQRLKD